MSRAPSLAGVWARMAANTQRARRFLMRTASCADERAPYGSNRAADPVTGHVTGRLARTLSPMREHRASVIGRAVASSARCSEVLPRPTLSAATMFRRGMEDSAMKKELSLLSVVAAGALATAHSAPAAAQAKANTQEIHIYAGWLFGDDLTDRTISGTRPKLDNDAVYGARYAYNFTDVWGAELSASYSPNHATHLGGADIKLDLTTVDVDAVWNF